MNLVKLRIHFYSLSKMPIGSVNRDFTLHCRHISSQQLSPLTCNLHQSACIVRLSVLHGEWNGMTENSNNVSSTHHF